MFKYLALFALLPGAALADDAATRTSTAPVFTKLDSTSAKSSNVIKGVKAIINGVELKKASLETTINPLLIGRKLETVKDYREAYSRDYLNPYYLELKGSIAPLTFGDETTAQVGSWSVGARWNLFNSTNPMSARAIDRLEDAAKEASKTNFTINESDVARFVGKVIEAELTAKCGTSTQAIVRGTWPVHAGEDASKIIELRATAALWESELRRGPSTSDRRCDAGVARKEALDGLVGALTARFLIRAKSKCVQFIPVLEESILLSERTLDAAARPIEDEWSAACSQRFLSEAAAHEAKLKALRENLESGLVIGVDGTINETATGTKTPGASEITAIRKREARVALQVGLRIYFPTWTLDVSTDLITHRVFLKPEAEDKTGPGGVTVSLELLRNQINNSSLLLSFSYNVEEEKTLEQKITVPIQEKLGLTFALKETEKGAEWKAEPSLALSWSYEQDGDKATRSIDFTK